MTDLQSAIESAERRYQSQLDRLEDLWAMELIDECGYRAGQRQAQIDCEAAISFAHVVAEWEAAPIVGPVEGDNQSRTGA